MCYCGITKRFAVGIVTAVSILTVCLSFSAFAAAILAFVNPTLDLAGISIQAGVMGLIDFVVLLGGGILGACGAKKYKLSCVLALFFCLLLATTWSYGMVVSLNDVYEQLVSDNQLPVGDGRFIAANNIERVAQLAQTNFCQPSLCTCKLQNTVFATAITALGAGVDANAGKSKFQDCASPYWFDEYKKPAAMMEALEKQYQCTGFIFSPPQNIYYFSDVDDVIPINGNTCNAFFDKLILKQTRQVAHHFIAIASGGLFFMIWIIVVGMNIQMSPKQLGVQSVPGGMVEMA